MGRGDLVDEARRLDVRVLAAREYKLHIVPVTDDQNGQCESCHTRRLGTGHQSRWCSRKLISIEDIDSGL